MRKTHRASTIVLSIISILVVNCTPTLKEGTPNNKYTDHQVQNFWSYKSRFYRSIGYWSDMGPNDPCNSQNYGKVNIGDTSEMVLNCGWGVPTDMDVIQYPNGNAVMTFIYRDENNTNNLTFIRFKMTENYYSRPRDSLGTSAFVVTATNGEPPYKITLHD